MVISNISMDWLSREKLQENPKYFMGKYLWFPVKIYKYTIFRQTLKCLPPAEDLI